jgi:signal transduction histidine kinase
VVDQLKQVFINISLNAIEAMQPDGGVIKLSLYTDAETQQIGVSFQDNGPGIAEENIPRLFEPLFTTKQNGLGLGLSICFDIIQAHSGRIAVNSQEGVGTKFTVWLPQQAG